VSPIPRRDLVVVIVIVVGVGDVNLVGDGIVFEKTWA
jgi:hypothetical protein